MCAREGMRLFLKVIRTFNPFEECQRLDVSIYSTFLSNGYYVPETPEMVLFWSYPTRLLERTPHSHT